MGAPRTDAELRERIAVELPPGLLAHIDRVVAVADALARSGRHFEQSVARQTMQWGGQLYRQRGPGGVLGRTWPTGSMVLWAVILLLAYLLFYYL